MASNHERSESHSDKASLNCFDDSLPQVDAGKEHKLRTDHIIAPAGTTDLNDVNLYGYNPWEAQKEAKEQDFVDLKTMGWFVAALVSIAESMGTGLLNFPNTFYQLGMAGGVIATAGAALLTYFAGCMMVDFRNRHPGVVSYPDAGAVMFGKWGRIIFGAGLVVKTMTVAGSHALLVQTPDRLELPFKPRYLRRLVGVVELTMSQMSISQEWKKTHILSAISIICLFSSSLIVLGGVATQPAPVLVKKGVPIVWHATPKNPTLISMITAISNIVFALGGNSAAFTFCAEMKNPNDFKNFLALVQGAGFIMYITIGAGIYAAGGQYVSSPAFSMTQRPVQIAAWSVALVTLMISACVRPLSSRAKAYELSSFGSDSSPASGLLGSFACQLIPFFSPLTTIIGSVFTTWFSIGFCGVMWFYNQHPYFAKLGEVRKLDTPLKWFLFFVASFCLLFVSSLPLLVFTQLGSVSETG
ncbi:hypothetical protein L198_07360 [Cryptococcus wingfieldii CBS 7118]|uniref:Amino acid transporter transmembrane domain-containing protein n=1 Tax=Cryptococcus wingfieldii CBS 7118 TaxID=1295528 RepID=A0A1E3IBU3_9TREE|nr:hypothetical protein L198_07360 [Cryptococcus wingfieldii CBS 7118]ODN86067.1 hypothetical protein L198_07360 [Cryptococcus wingfieldii CBS 7118]